MANTVIGSPQEQLACPRTPGTGAQSCSWQVILAWGAQEVLAAALFSLLYLCSLENVLSLSRCLRPLTWFFSGQVAVLGHPHSLSGSCKEVFPELQAFAAPWDLCLTPLCAPPHTPQATSFVCTWYFL